MVDVRTHPAHPTVSIGQAREAYALVLKQFVPKLA